MNNVFNDYFNAEYKWSELNNKKLKISTYEEDGFVSVAGYEEETGNVYILFSGREE